MKTKMKDKIKTQLKEIYRSAYKCKHKKEIAGAILAVLVLSWCVCSCHTSGTKAMIIDFARVQQEAEAYKAIMTEQRSYEEKLQAQFSIEAGTLQKEEESLLEQKKKLGDSAFKKKADELQKKALDLQQKYRYQAQQILAASQAAATKLQPEVEKAVEKNFSGR